MEFILQKYLLNYVYFLIVSVILKYQQGVAQVVVEMWVSSFTPHVERKIKNIIKLKNLI